MGSRPIPVRGLRAVYRRDGRLFIPTRASAAAWAPDLQHGSAVAALVATAVEEVPTPVPMDTARMHFDFLRPIRRDPIGLRARVVRGDRRVQLVDAIVSTADGTPVCRASVLRIRRTAAAIATPTRRDFAPPGPESARDPGGPIGGFAAHAVELRLESGGWDPAPDVAWIRLRLPVVEGQEPTPLVRLAAAADLGGGVGSESRWQTHVFTNPDLALLVDRLPGGEWVALRASMTVHANGTPSTGAVLYDEYGEIGVATTSLLVDRH